MAVYCGNKYKIYIETSDGLVMEVNAISSKVEIKSRFDSLVETTLEFTSFDKALWTDGEVFRKKLKEKTAAPEWKCDFCGRPNARERETCHSCGAVRSFIYG